MYMGYQLSHFHAAAIRYLCHFQTAKTKGHLVWYMQYVGRERRASCIHLVIAVTQTEYTYAIGGDGT
jgi:hypothetical protein